MGALLLCVLGAADLSLSDAQALAQARAPELALARTDEAVARAEVDVAGALLNPSLTVQSASQTAHLTTGLTVPVPLFGQRGRALEAARAGYAAQRLRTEEARLEARLEATLRWVALWEAQARLELLTAAAESTGRLAQVARARFAEGAAPAVDVARAGAEAARARAELRLAAAEVTASSAALAGWLGIAAGVRAAEPPSPGPAPERCTPTPGEIDAHPSAARARAETDAARARVALEQRQRWPMVSLTAQVAALDPTLPGLDVSGGVGLELPVLSQRGGAVARAEAEASRADQARQALERRLRADLDAACARTQGAFERLSAMNGEVLPAMTAARQMTEESYRDGRVDLFRLVDAQRALVDAQLTRAAAVAQWVRERAQLERASAHALEGGGDATP